MISHTLKVLESTTKFDVTSYDYGAASDWHRRLVGYYTHPKLSIYSVVVGGYIGIIPIDDCDNEEISRCISEIMPNCNVSYDIFNGGWAGIRLFFESEEDMTLFLISI
jgi:hypothetical protein